MKTPILLALALVGGLALVARSSEEVPKAAKPSETVAPEAFTAPAGPETMSTSPAGTVAVASPVPAVSASPAFRPEAGGLRAPESRTLTGRLERELALSPLQAGRVEEIFQAREADVAVIQARVISTGVFDPRTTDPQLARLREESYRQISMLLDEGQNRRFAEILAGNLINDHMVIALPEPVLVLE